MTARTHADIIAEARRRIEHVDFDDPAVTFDLMAIRDLLAVIDEREASR